MLACERVGDNYWLSADLQEPCLEGRHTMLLVLLCVPQLLLHVVGLPLGAFVVLFRNRKRLFKEDVQFRWGLLYAATGMTFLVGANYSHSQSRARGGRGVFGSRLGPDMQVYMALAMILSSAPHGTSL